jgi:hypothetical protein
MQNEMGALRTYNMWEKYEIRNNGKTQEMRLLATGR